MNNVSHQIIFRVALIVLTSFTVCALVVMTQRWHGRLSLDHDVNGAQKLHHQPVPRIGGLGLFLGLLVAVISSYFIRGNSFPTTLMLLLCATPVYLSGLLEDLTKRISVRTRLIASFVSAGLAIWLLNARLTGLDTPILDSLLALPAISVVFTVFAIAGVTHSINILDGLNGLASGAVFIMLAGIATISWACDDTLVLKLCIWGMAAVLGFMILNFPFGRIFLGDGGAYLAGFWLAECATLLFIRNPDVSPWAILLCCLYPVLETVYTILRRQLISRSGSSKPDMVHMHHLIFMRLATWGIVPSIPAWLRHAISSTFIWILISACQTLAFILHHNTPALLSTTLAFCLAYAAAYRMLINNVRPPLIEEGNQQMSLKEQ